MKKILFSLLLLSSLAIARDEKVSYKEFPFKGHQVSLRIENIGDKSISALIEVRKGLNITSKKNFAVIKGSGGHAAVYMSRRQKLDDVFLIHKFGDFDSRTLMVNEDGKLFNLPGGDIFYDEEAKILFFLRNFETEPYAEYAAYDIKKKTMIFHYKDSAKKHTFSDQLAYKILKGDKMYYALSTNKEKGGAVEMDVVKKKVKRSTYAIVSKLKLRALQNL